MADKELKSYDIDKVEIFRTGKWNGEVYTEVDLDDMVSAHEEIGKELKPYLKLGHDNDQKLLQKSGMPAAGWITKLWREGQSLYGKLQSVPEKVKKLIDLKQYGRLSAEIYWNLAHQSGKTYRRALKAVALLGADTPELGSLEDFINLYTENIKADVKMYHVLKEYKAMDEIKNPEIESKVKELEAKVAEYTKKLEDSERVKSEYEAKFSKIEQEKKDIEIKSFMDAQVKEGKITPVQVEMFTKLINGETKEDNGDVKNYQSRLDVVKNIISSSAKVDFSERSVTGETSTKTYSNANNAEEKTLDDIIDEKVIEYMKKNNEKDYRKAFEAVQTSMVDEKGGNK